MTAKKIIIALTLVALCLGLATCEKSCDLAGGKPADGRRTAVSPKPAVPRSPWVGKWVSNAGNVSYVIESEKNGSLYGYIPRGSSGREKVVMKIVNAGTASYVTPVGVKVTFKRSGDRLTVSSLGVGAQALRIVK